VRDEVGAVREELHLGLAQELVHLPVLEEEAEAEQRGPRPGREEVGHAPGGREALLAVETPLAPALAERPRDARRHGVRGALLQHAPRPGLGGEDRERVAHRALALRDGAALELQRADALAQPRARQQVVLEQQRAPEAGGRQARMARAQLGLRLRGERLLEHDGLVEDLDLRVERERLLLRRGDALAQRLAHLRHPVLEVRVVRELVRELVLLQRLVEPPGVEGEIAALGRDDEAVHHGHVLLHVVQHVARAVVAVHRAERAVAVHPEGVPGRVARLLVGAVPLVDALQPVGEVDGPLALAAAHRQPAVVRQDLGPLDAVEHAGVQAQRIRERRERLLAPAELREAGDAVRAVLARAVAAAQVREREHELRLRVGPQRVAHEQAAEQPVAVAVARREVGERDQHVAGRREAAGQILAPAREQLVRLRHRGVQLQRVRQREPRAFHQPAHGRLLPRVVGLELRLLHGRARAQRRQHQRHEGREQHRPREQRVPAGAGTFARPARRERQSGEHDERRRHHGLQREPEVEQVGHEQPAERRRQAPDEQRRDGQRELVAAPRLRPRGAREQGHRQGRGPCEEQRERRQAGGLRHVQEDVVRVGRLGRVEEAAARLEPLDGEKGRGTDADHRVLPDDGHAVAPRVAAEVERLLEAVEARGQRRARRVAAGEQPRAAEQQHAAERGGGEHRQAHAPRRARRERQQRQHGDRREQRGEAGARVGQPRGAREQQRGGQPG